MAARTATLWRLAQDWIDLETGALLCAAEDFACAGNGAAAVGGRWNSVGRPVIYLADSLALAQLEKRVHTPMRPPRDLVAVEAIVPAAAVASAEGVVLPDDWDADKATLIADKILTDLNAPYDLGTVRHRSTPSIGIACFDGGEERAEDLLRRADEAMYRAKAGGRNRLETQQAS